MEDRDVGDRGLAREIADLAANDAEDHASFIDDGDDAVFGEPIADVDDSVRDRALRNGPRDPAGPARRRDRSFDCISAGQPGGLACDVVVYVGEPEGFE